MELKENERIDDLEFKGFKIIQNSEGFCFGIDAVLLSDFAKNIKNKSKVLDLGTGTGILPILLAGKTNLEKIIGVEIQKDVYDMAKRSIALNKLENRCEIINENILNLEKIYNNYPYIESNILWLNSFIEEYRNSEQRNITEKNEEVVMQIKRKNDKKIATEELILDKKTLKPTKLSIMDNSKNVIVYILYNEIEIK